MCIDLLFIGLRSDSLSGGGFLLGHSGDWGVRADRIIPPVTLGQSLSSRAVLIYAEISAKLAANAAQTVRINFLFGQRVH